MDSKINTLSQTGMQENQRTRKKGLNGSTLKMIAIITMLIDHIGAVVLTRILMQRGLAELAYTDMATQINWLMENGVLYYTMFFMRMTLGRLAFPIFCFLLVEGFQKTHDVKRYAIRLGLFALVSEIPFDLSLSSSPFNLQYQNVFFTLFVGLLTLIGIKAVEKQNWNRVLKILTGIVITVIGMVVAKLLHTDYDAVGVLLIVALYVFRKHKAWQIISGCLVLGPGTLLLMKSLSEVLAMLSFLFIGFYNGERGWKLKYVFYLFYPLHLLILYLICVLMGIGGIPAM